MLGMCDGQKYEVPGARCLVKGPAARKGPWLKNETVVKLGC